MRFSLFVADEESDTEFRKEKENTWIAKENKGRSEPSMDTPLGKR